MTYLQRYLAGEHQAVWRELCALGEAVNDPDVLPDAEAVALALMERVATNVDQIVGRLEMRGYEFGRYPAGDPVPGVRCARVRPLSEAFAAANKLVTRVGAVPVSLRSFWRVVGEVVLVGRDPKGGLPSYSDPLWIDGPEAALAELEDGLGFQEGGGTFLCPLAPDVLHKDNISGSGPYEIALPNGTFDAALQGEWRKLSFVGYLRTAILDWGGFPGLSPESPQQLWRRGCAVAPWVLELKNDLQPF